jgi:hypothetical protein
MKMNSRHACALLSGAAGILVIAGAVALAVCAPASATPQFAADTGKACGDCHTAAAGGGPLTPLGTKFKANGNKMPK